MMCSKVQWYGYWLLVRARGLIVWCVVLFQKNEQHILPCKIRTIFRGRALYSTKIRPFVT
jgi:hypothetical protein